MPKPIVEHTYLIETSTAGIHWRLTVGPRDTNNPEKGPCIDDVSLQVILELVKPADAAQLDFGF